MDIDKFSADPRRDSQTGLASRAGSFAGALHLEPRLSAAIALSDAHQTECHRHGTTLTACSHIVTAVIGGGILALPYAMGMLGWMAGVGALLAFFLVATVMSVMLARCCEVKGVRMRRYGDVVHAILGPKYKTAATTLQYVNLVLSGIAYTIAAGNSAQAIHKALSCDSAENCEVGSLWQQILLFGAIQLFFSQLPDLDSVWWVSAMGAVMSIGYSTLALGMSASHADNMHGSIGGIPGSPSDKLFGVFNALGSLAFAFNFASVLVEIQDTLKEPPKASTSMTKAIAVSITTSGSFYMAVSVCGYLAFGNEVGGDILAQSGLGPRWCVVMANIFVYVHMVSAFQVYSQPVYNNVEKLLVRRFKAVAEMNALLVNLIFRSSYVVLIALLSSMMPFFSSIVGLCGALVFWPLGVLLPTLMYLRCHELSTAKKHALAALNGIMFLVTICAVIGSVESIISNAGNYKIFA